MDINTYNPGNSSITADELNAMKDFSDDEIRELAKTYPNSPNGNAYLVYYDNKTDAKSQLYPLGTWANLAALRKLGYKHILAYSFKDKFYQKKAVANAHKPTPSRTVDLSVTEKLEGLKVSVPVGEGTANIITNELHSEDHLPSEDQNISAIDEKLLILEVELQELRIEKAHHMTIKAKEKEIEEHKKTVG